MKKNGSKVCRAGRCASKSGPPRFKARPHTIIRARRSGAFRVGCGRALSCQRKNLTLFSAAQKPAGVKILWCTCCYVRAVRSMQFQGCEQKFLYGEFLFITLEFFSQGIDTRRSSLFLFAELSIGRILSVGNYTSPKPIKLIR